MGYDWILLERSKLVKLKYTFLLCPTVAQDQMTYGTAPVPAPGVGNLCIRIHDKQCTCKALLPFGCVQSLVTKIYLCVLVQNYTLS